MTAIKKPPGMPTAAEVRAKIDAAERAFLMATVALGEALVVQIAMPDRDVSAEQAAVDAARRTVDQLKAMLPIVERVEAEALAATRAALADDQRRQLQRELPLLLKHAMAFSAHYANSVSAFRRMVRSGEAILSLLNPSQIQKTNGQMALQF
jgi:DNA primase